MADKTTQARDAARTIKRDTQLRAPILRQYKVDVVNSDGTVDIETEAGVVPNVRRIASSALNVGDTVWCLRAGVDILIVDKVATDNNPKHDHDARYVETVGDAMTGALLVETGDVRLRRDVSGTTHDLRLWQGAGASPIEHRRGGTVVSSLWWRDGSIEAREDFHVVGSLDVAGAKNAKIPHPDDPTRAFKFAASESNTPGIMEVYCGEHEVDTSRELTLRQTDLDGLIDPVYLADYVKLGRNPRVRLDAAGPREDNAPHSPYAWAEWDLNDPRIEIRAPAGKYHVELRFIRNDPPVQGWQHEIEVQPEPEEEEEPDNV